MSTELTTNAPPLAEADLAEIQRLYDAATAGGWYKRKGGICGPSGQTYCVEPVQFTDRGGMNEANADFIIAAHEQLPRVLARIRDLTAEVLLAQAQVRDSEEARVRDAQLLDSLVKLRKEELKKYDLLVEQHRGYDDLVARISRQIRDASLQARTRLTIENERLRLELHQVKRERDAAIAAHEGCPERGEGTVPA